MIRRILKKTKCILNIKTEKEAIVEIVIKEKLSYLSSNALSNLYDEVKNTNHLDGIIIETGCALGGSAIAITKAKAKGRIFKIYDVFDIIPPPSDRDGNDVIKRYEVISTGRSAGIGGDEYYGYKENLLNIVKDNFKKCNVNIDDSIKFIKGLYQDTLVVKEPVSFAHIDCDWYDSVMTCLNSIVPNLVVGGKLVIDDYNDWSGCRSAVDNYFSDTSFKSDFIFTYSEKLLIERIK